MVGIQAAQNPIAAESASRGVSSDASTAATNANAASLSSNGFNLTMSPAGRYRGAGNARGQSITLNPSPYRPFSAVGSSNGGTRSAGAEESAVAGPSGTNSAMDPSVGKFFVQTSFVRWLAYVGAYR